VLSPTLLLHYATPSLARAGAAAGGASVINISSVLGVRPLVGNVPYR